MNCEIARRMTEANDPALAQHLRSCPSCIVGAHARYYEAPAALEQKIRASLRREAAPNMPWRWIAIAASILLAVSAVWNFTLLRSRVAPRQLLAENVLSAHLRSLNGTHLLDVPSTDQHTVKPWFAGKLDFSPPVKEVDGFPLLGGRIEYFEGHSAAALVYGRRAHIVNLFVWPSITSTPESSQTRNGYQMRTWYGNGMTFWAVSDLNPAELADFVSIYRRN
jgi:anti-sigma factor RsiW